MTKKTLTIERILEAAAPDVWALWTTKEGIEAWWGPDGFATTVHEIDVQVGGQLHYAMTAIAAPQIDFLKKAGMPLTNEQTITYAEVVPRRRLAYTSVADFVPGVAPYTVATLVELHPHAQGVRLVLTIDAMHDERWTNLAVMGWESELAKLAQVLARRALSTG
jgi:uncharacterized protein YndB with AHSA1/START domain